MIGSLEGFGPFGNLNKNRVWEAVGLFAGIVRERTDYEVGTSRRREGQRRQPREPSKGQNDHDKLPHPPRSHPTTPDHKTIVTFLPADPADPRNLPVWRKWTVVASITLVDLTVSWGASGFSPAGERFTKLFHVSSQVGALGLSLYALGLAFGSMCLAPLSNYYGGTPLCVLLYGAVLLFLLGTALADDLGGFLALRFLFGLCASVIIANFGGAIADVWPRHQAGPKMPSSKTTGETSREAFIQEGSSAMSVFP